MPQSPDQDLSRRERQTMNVLNSLERASVTEIAAELSDPPSGTAICTHLQILEEKGHVAEVREWTVRVLADVEDPRESVAADCEPLG